MTMFLYGTAAFQAILGFRATFARFIMPFIGWLCAPCPDLVNRLLVSGAIEAIKKASARLPIVFEGAGATWAF